MDDGSKGGLIAALVVVPAMAVCCGGPLLLATGAGAVFLGAAGSWLAGYGGIALLILAALAAVLFVRSRRPARTAPATREAGPN
jgi:hypothetical protein